MKVGLKAKVMNQGKSIKLEYLHHISVNCWDVELSVRFYCDVLGLAEIERPPFSFPGAWLQGFGLQIHLIQAQQAAPEQTAEINSRVFHLAFLVTDLDAAEEKLRDRKIPYVRRINAAQAEQIFFQDPAGLNIEVTSG